MIEPAEHDYVAYHGSDFLATWVLYSDTRLKRWRGEFDEEREYLPGDAVQAENGSAWVCTSCVQFTGPLTIGQSQWSELEPFNATGYTFEIVVDPEIGRAHV